MGQAKGLGFRGPGRESFKARNRNLKVSKNVSQGLPAPGSHKSEESLGTSTKEIALRIFGGFLCADVDVDFDTDLFDDLSLFFAWGLQGKRQKNPQEQSPKILPEILNKFLPRYLPVRPHLDSSSCKARLP